MNIRYATTVTAISISAFVALCAITLILVLNT